MKAMRRVGHDSYRLARCLGACLLIAASLAACAQPAHRHSLLGKPAPQFARRGISGQTIDLGRLRGKVVLLNFWATWCGPCEAEMPIFAAWQREYGPDGLQVIGISMDDDDATARRFVQKLKLDYPVAMGDARLGKQYGGVLGLPMTFLIGRDGKVLAEYQGETDLKAMEARVKEALNKP